jgi:hypothetical protein
MVLCSCRDESTNSKREVDIKFTKEGNAQLLKIDADSSYARFDIEFAKTAYETQTGLMHRSSMQNNQGMLFVFEEAAPRFFYMKNTRIPLDIIYLSEEQIIVSFHKEAQPFSKTSLPSIEAAKYVLEINAGLIESLGIEVGDRLTFTDDQ